MIRPLLLAGVALAAAGCMEVQQTVPTEKQVGTTVRRDTAAWNNAPLAGGPAWKQGDRTSWDEQIKKRQLAQSEDRRIYQ